MSVITCYVLTGECASRGSCSQVRQSMSNGVLAEHVGVLHCPSCSACSWQSAITWGRKKAPFCQDYTYVYQTIFELEDCWRLSSHIGCSLCCSLCRMKTCGWAEAVNRNATAVQIPIPLVLALLHICHKFAIFARCQSGPRLHRSDSNPRALLV